MIIDYDKPYETDLTAWQIKQCAFYGAKTKDELIREQAKHIERLSDWEDSHRDPDSDMRG